MKTKNPYTDYVELNRKFHAFISSDLGEDIALNSYTLESNFQNTFGLSWSDLRTNKITIILGEPGSGKTREFKEQANFLRQNGEVAFYIRLDQVVDKKLHDIFDNSERKLLRKWRNGRRTAHFFLDSVDESKFRKASEFYDAIDNFTKSIGNDGLNKSCIFISSRISEWQPITDTYEVQARLAAITEDRRINKYNPNQEFKEKNNDLDAEVQITSASQNKSIPSLSVVVLLPLDRGRVKLLIAARDIGDSNEFIEALDSSHLWEFARRPLDVNSLICYWRENRQFGSISEVLEFDTELKLNPAQRDRDDPLSIELAREGAQSLAAATLFCRNLNFKIPDEANIETSALSAQSCLSSKWSMKSINALLNRPIFDAASYGQIRFHHRKSAQYLAAKWVSQFMKSGCTMLDIEHLFFYKDNGEIIARPSLTPVLCWLSNGNDAWNLDIRCLILAHCPEIHLSCGDPASLPIAYRKRILQQLIKQYSKRGHTWIESSIENLKRLAHNELASEVATIACDSENPVELRNIAVRMIGAGKIHACSDILFEIAIATENHISTRCIAIEMLGCLKEYSIIRKLAEIILTAKSSLVDFTETICAEAFPQAMTASEFIFLVFQQGGQVFQMEGKKYALKHILMKANPETASELICLASKHFTRHAPHFISWTAEPLLVCIKKCLEKHHLSQSEIESLTLALNHYGKHKAHYINALDDEEIESINTLTKKHGNLRASWFWAIICQIRSDFAKEPIPNFVIHQSILRLNAEDSKWLLESLNQSISIDDKRTALHFIFHLNNTYRTRLCCKNILKSASPCSDLMKSYIEYASLYRFRNIKKFWYEHCEKFTRRWWWDQRISRLKESTKQIKAQYILHKHIDKLRSGEATHWLTILVREADPQHTHSWAPTSWHALQAKRGMRILLATQEGCKRTWKTFKPLLPHEKPEQDKTDWRVILGLAGLQVELAAEDSLLSKLSFDEVNLATRYAISELNGFSSWLTDLARLHPLPVKNVICECIAGEWLNCKADTVCHGVIYKIASAHSTLDNFAAEALWDLLKNGDPLNNSILEFAIVIITRTSEWRDNILQLAKNRITSLSAQHNTIHLWLVVLFQLDGNSAINCLEKVLEASPNPSFLLTTLCAFLNQGSFIARLIISNPSYLQASSLRRFIPIVYRHIRPEEDKHHAGCYTPDARDDAQQFRGRLLTLLSESESNCAIIYLKELAEVNEMRDQRDWILHLLAERKKSRSELSPWQPSDIQMYSSSFDFSPKTDSELFAIAKKRLIQIKLDVEKAENSLRTELHKDYDETEFRKWLHRKFRERSNNLYTVPEEVEIDLAQRPDLRIENPRTNAISIEIKWADNWSYGQLEEGLINQLIGQYLRAHNAHYGIYVLGLIGKPDRKSWRPINSRKSISFSKVIDLLSRKATSIIESNNNVHGIEVVGIDFQRPI